MVFIFASAFKRPSAATEKNLKEIITTEFTDRLFDHLQELLTDRKGNQPYDVQLHTETYQYRALFTITLTAEKGDSSLASRKDGLASDFSKKIVEDLGKGDWQANSFKTVVNENGSCTFTIDVGPKQGAGGYAGRESSTENTFIQNKVKYWLINKENAENFRTNHPDDVDDLLANLFVDTLLNIKTMYNNNWLVQSEFEYPAKDGFAEKFMYALIHNGWSDDDARSDMEHIVRIINSPGNEYELRMAFSGKPEIAKSK